jgi:glucokinase
MILAGDIGGTKTVLGLFASDGDVRTPVREARFPSGDYPSLEAIVAEFLAGTDVQPSVACFGVAGPVVGDEAKITNLPWVISAPVCSNRFNIPRVYLINDLRALATEVPHLDAEDVVVINEGAPLTEGAIAVVAPGTGLGEAFLVWIGDRYRAYPTEGGHASFAPNSRDELNLLVFLERRFGHVSFERVCSGSGIPNIYDFVRDSGRYEEPAWLREALAGDVDRTPPIVNAALDGKADICRFTLTLFVRILGGVIGNMAVKVLATGGVFIGGGIAPRILSRLREPDFMAAVTHKGRFSEMMSRVPVKVIQEPQAALRGAAWFAHERL